MANYVAGVISAVVLVILVGALLGTVTDFSIGKQGSGNITGATSTILGVVPIVFLIGVLLAVLATVGVYKFKGS